MATRQCSEGQAAATPGCGGSPRHHALPPGGRQRHAPRLERGVPTPEERGGTTVPATTMVWGGGIQGRPTVRRLPEATVGGQPEPEGRHGL